jgi:hypothetical protein
VTRQVAPSDGTSPWRDERNLAEAHALTRIFVAKQLGVKPWRRADQLAAVINAGNVLASLTTIEATKARRILAVEYCALAGRSGRRGPVDWLAAVRKVHASEPADVANMARGGLSLRASSGGWNPRPAPPNGGSPIS